QSLVGWCDEDIFAAAPAEWAAAIAALDAALAACNPVPADVRRVLDSVTNLENWVVTRNGVPIEDAGIVITGIQFGLNQGNASVAGYPLTNKFETVITFDANPAVPGNQPLPGGDYVVVALHPLVDNPSTTATDEGRSGLRDKLGNPLASNGLLPGGADLSRSFTLSPLGAGKDESVTAPIAQALRGRTHPETPNAVAMDPDGDHVVVVTAEDLTVTPLSVADSSYRDRVWMRLYNADGSPAATEPLLVRVADDALFPNGVAAQRHAAVAMDGDGDYIVTWTQYDPVYDQVNAQRRRVYEHPTEDRKIAYDAVQDKFFYVGTSTAVLNLPLGTDPEDLVPVIEANVYMRRFNAAGDPLPSGSAQWALPANDPRRTAPILVNTWGTPDFILRSVGGDMIPTDQKWSDVAVDADGDFIIVWTSDSQEDNGQQGNAGYGIYARRFDAFGQPLAAEFQVNVTVEGNQMLPSVDMDAYGGFVVAWQSEQDLVGTEIVARTFWPDGTPQETSLAAGPLFGEILVNSNTTDGNQTFPDVAMSVDGLSYVVTWTGLDGSGTGIFAKQIQRTVLPNTISRLIFPDTLDPLGLAIPDPGVITDTIFVPSSFSIADLDLRLSIEHFWDPDLTIELISPAGTVVALSDQNPRDPNNNNFPFVYGGANARLNLANYTDTVFDDEALVQINNYPTAAPPYTGRFIPEVPLLAAFDGENALGTWTLRITDNTLGPFRDLDGDGIGGEVPDDLPLTFLPQFLKSWSLDFAPDVIATLETVVNTSTDGDQMYSSVSVDGTGGFVIAWGGRGDEALQEDLSYSGVYFQRFSPAAAPVGAETRLNREVPGRQWIPSIATDANGNFAAVWTGEGVVPGTTDVYRRLSSDFFSVADTTGPIVTDVLTSDGRQVFDGGVLDLDTLAPINQLKVVFSEDLSSRWVESSIHGVVGDPGPDSVFNPQNWVLLRNGVELPGAIVRVTDYRGLPQSNPGNPDFQRNPATRKYEAIVSFDGDSLANGVQPLAAGEYVLVLRDTVHDDYRYVPSDPFFGGNALDGDRDGTPGTRVDGLRLQYQSHPGFQIGFTATRGTSVGAEFRINDETLPEQVFSQWDGTGWAKEKTTRSVAVDHDGDFVVVWTSYGHDLEHPTDSDVYLRMYDRNNNPLTGEIRVNTDRIGHQRNASVTIDADGEFVVVWEGETAPPDGFLDWDSYGHLESDWNIYGQRFDSTGTPVGTQFLVNTNTTGEQLNPAVASDLWGNFVVVWATKGDDYSFFNDVRGQVYNYRGERVSAEFRVNEQNIPGTLVAPGSIEINPTVAMDRDGNFVVAWEQITAQRNGVAFDTSIYGRKFDAAGNPTTAEVQINNPDDDFVSDPEHNPHEGAGGGQIIEREARNPQAAIDADGNIIIVWESFQDNDLDAGTGPESYGIYFQRFNPDLTIDGNHHQANLVITSTLDDPARVDPVRNSDLFAFGQVNPTVGIDADGDYAIAWNGNGAVPHPTDPDTLMASNADRDGVWIRSFHSSDGVPATPEFVSVQTRVNVTWGGEQKFPSLGMEPDGDMIVVWNGVGVGDQRGIFARRYDERTDTAGPLVTDLLTPEGDRIMPGAQVDGSLGYLVVSFDEEMMTSGAGSVKNVANYRLLRNGVQVPGGITSVDFALGPNNKWEAKLNLAANLPEGNYEIVVRNSVRDKVGNALGSNGRIPNGEEFRRSFNLMPFRVGGGEQLVNVGATDGAQHTAGDWGSATSTISAVNTVASDADGDYVVVWTSEAPAKPGVFAQMYTAAGTAIGPAIEVTNDPSAEYASVARDADGDFIVTWSQKGGAGLPVDDWNVWARRYDAAGNALENPVNGTSGAFLVNSETLKAQRYSSVAMDVDGDSIIVWQSLDQDGEGYGIYAQRYSPAGNPIGGFNEIQMLDFTGVAAGSFRLRYNGAETVAIQYNGNATEFSGGSSFAEKVQKALRDIGARVVVTALNLDQLRIEFGGSDGNKDVGPISVVPVTIKGLKDPTTVSEGDSGEFRVNDTTELHQMWPSVASDAAGNLVVTWTSWTWKWADLDGDGVPDDRGLDRNGDGVPDVPPQGTSDPDIYAKTLPRNEVIGGSRISYTAATAQPISPNWIDGTRFETTYISVDNPDYHVVLPGTMYDGVGVVDTPLGSGSGTLLMSGNHVLTAAHVVDGSPAAGIFVTFETPNGITSIQASRVYVHPDYNGDPFFDGNDIAVIELVAQAPPEVHRFDIYRADDELTKVGDKFGYGMSGTGDVGQQFSDGLMRTGQNRYDALGSSLGMSDNLLAYDFDNGLPQNDAFGQVRGLNDLGLGRFEVMTAPGDSGGPTFINGLIGGVTTGRASVPGSHDVIPGYQSSFGDFGLDTRVSSYADWIDQITVNRAEFLVNEDGTDYTDPTNPIPVDNITGDQMWSSVAMDASGDFVITWTSRGRDNTGGSYGADYDGENGVYARRYTPTTNVNFWSPAAMSDPFQVNSATDGDQQHSRVAIDADGDFVITWESFPGLNPDQAGGNADDTTYGIHAQRYARNNLLGVNQFLGPNGEIGGELAINTTKEGNQRYPGVAMDDRGDFVIVWSGNGAQPNNLDAQGIFSQRFQKADDDAGPMVADVFRVVGDTAADAANPAKRRQLFDTAFVDTPISQMVITFGEDLWAAGSRRSVLDEANWRLTKDGVDVAGGVQIEPGDFTFNPVTRKYELRITLDGDAIAAGNQPLGPGQYVLSARDDIADLAGNALDGDWDGRPQGLFRRTFTMFGASGGPGSPNVPGGPGSPSLEAVDTPVNINRLGNQDSPAVATNARGDYVVVWVTYPDILRDVAGDPILDADGNFIYSTDGTILGQRYNRYGQPQGNEFAVHTFATGSQIDPDVAMDSFGNFVVTWAGNGPVDSSGVYAKVFDANGLAIAEEFRVNQWLANTQGTPQVAMEAGGDFVVVWAGAGADDTSGIYGRRFNARGQALGDEFRVHTAGANAQMLPDVAMDDAGRFVVVWNSADGSLMGVYGQRYTETGAKAGGEFQVNTTTNDKQDDPQVAMDADGDFVVTWSSFLQDGSGYGVFARRYNSGGAPQGGEFRVNETPLAWQHQSDVSMDDAGRFVVTWSTFGQDNADRFGRDAYALSDYGIYARLYNADGTPMPLDLDGNGTTEPSHEFRINALTQGDQVQSAVAMDSDGDLVVAWTGLDFALYQLQDPPFLDPDPPLPVPGGSLQTDVYQRVIALNPATYHEEFLGAINPFDFEDGAGAGNSLSLAGTAGNDVIVISPTATAGRWSVVLNGLERFVAGANVTVSFDGLGGNDTVKFTGSSGADNATLYPDRAEFKGPGYSMAAANIEAIEYDGVGGQDTVDVWGSSAANTYTARPGSAEMTGGGVSITAKADRIYGRGGGGADTATIWDSPGNDLFEFFPIWARATGDGYFHHLQGFTTMIGKAELGAGGTDEAIFRGSSQGDWLKSTTVTTRMLTLGAWRHAEGFDTITAYSRGSSDKPDTFIVNDTPGADTLKLKPLETVLVTPAYKVTAYGFGNVEATRVNVNAADDKLTLEDSTGNDTLVGNPAWVQMSGAGPAYSNKAAGFPSVMAYSTGEGLDKAFFSDFNGAADNRVEDDAFTASSTVAELAGPGYRLWARFFDEVHAETKLGHDLANLTGTTGIDSVSGTATQVSLSGTNAKGTFANYAKYFDEIHAFGAAGQDKAVVTDATVEPNYQPPAGVNVNDLAQVLWLNQMEKIERQTTGGGKTEINNVDEVFSYWD
ncbi:MAG: trypsin-like serine protease, partial [Pirellulales bacterium]|nr:trypsin-like serine protease [Pirellulales bacterium]